MSNDNLLPLCSTVAVPSCSLKTIRDGHFFASAYLSQMFLRFGLLSKLSVINRFLMAMLNCFCSCWLRRWGTPREPMLAPDFLPLVRFSMCFSFMELLEVCKRYIITFGATIGFVCVECVAAGTVFFFCGVLWFWRGGKHGW